MAWTCQQSVMNTNGVEYFCPKVCEDHQDVRFREDGIISCPYILLSVLRGYTKIENYAFVSVDTGVLEEVVELVKKKLL